jgi:hypothetical protein
MTLVQGLLIENRYWTFWSGDWKYRINIYWGGETKWKDVVRQVKQQMAAIAGVSLHALHEMVYEREVQLREPDMSFK